MIDTETEPTTNKRQKLMVHIIERDANGAMKDKTLCGKLWDHPVVTATEICPDCEEIAKRDGHEWQA